MLLTATRLDAPPPQVLDGLDHAIETAEEALLRTQRPDGHFVFELEADVSIPCEYILFMAFRGLPMDRQLELKFARYIRDRQKARGGWPLFEGGGFNMSSSVKAYFALKMLGDDPQAPHMVRARETILGHGGAAHSNVFTRALLALFGEVPWSAVPVMPVEIMHLPRWFPFHLDKVSYWARTVLAPMMVVNAVKPKAANPRDVHVPELFVVPADKVRRWPGSVGQSKIWSVVFNGVDLLLRAAEPHMPAGPRRRAMAKAEAYTTDRLNGVDGLGAIYPAMAYSAMMYAVIGEGEDDPRFVQAVEAIDRLIVEYDDYAYMQPCVSPVWDTALAAHALMEAGHDRNSESVKEALDWLKPRQVLDLKGDWAAQKPDVRPGGWAFQYNNAYFPDLDDTAVVVMAMDRAQDHARSAIPDRYKHAIERAREWVEGLQSRNGAWGAFDADNDHEYLNNIPFADHGALLDPPTADVTARCISMLAQLGETQETSPAMKRAVDYLVETQEKDGSWFGRWGMNYIYGTWVRAMRFQCRQGRSRERCGAACDPLPAHQPEPRRRLGRGRRNLRARVQRLPAGRIDGLADGLGSHRADGGGRDRRQLGRARYPLPHADAGDGRLLERGALHRDRLPESVLPALPRLR